MEAIKPITGRVAVVGGENLSTQIQIVQNHPDVDVVKIEGGGSLTRPTILRKRTIFDDSVYSIDITDRENIILGYSVTDYGAFLIADGVLVEGSWRPPKALDDYWKHGQGWNPNDPYLLAVQALTEQDLAGTGTTILESTYINGPNPAISVFQALGDSRSAHCDKSERIAVIGFHIKGRQREYDGGVRSTILFGNAHRSLAMWNYLEDTASIGITFGGSALEFRRQEDDGSVTLLKDNYAKDVVCCHNVFSGVAAANTATINTEDAYVFHNYYRKLGHRLPRPNGDRFGGGVSAHDHETNSGADHTMNIWISDNLADFEDSAWESAGSAFVVQDPYYNESEGTHRGATFVVNNVAIGGRNDRLHRYMSNGIYLNGLQRCTAINNYVFRTGQNAIQAYAISDSLIQDNDFEATGGGGQVSVYTEGAFRNVFRRNNYRDRPGLGISTASGFYELGGKDNIYEDNLTNGVDIPNVLRVPYP